jgi:hypothetical protein
MGEKRNAYMVLVGNMMENMLKWVLITTGMAIYWIHLAWGRD